MKNETPETKVTPKTVVMVIIAALGVGKTFATDPDLPDRAIAILKLLVLFL